MDIETGEGIGAGETSDRSICSSEEGGSCISQFFSTYDGMEFRIPGGFRIALGKLIVEKDCRICHLTLDDDQNGNNNSYSIQLGCCYRDDLGAAHKHCAETWFKMKGNT
ncbi:uncharacterized protein LOC124938939 [Impatiens glandulifera]|uniref:uncharacterized protein LOC124938939 n=1 Tax=Impatiens glandulifera TaxID=253017 RepID=UPI001FB19DFB|nr:uncharacterized protein LOC124938939 [Impatiens glandulifera]